MSFLLTEFRQELAALRILKGKLAHAVGVTPSHISEILAGTRRPTDEITRRILFVFSFVRAAEMENGGFAFDRAGINLLRREIRKMEASTVKSTRHVNDSPVEENAECHAN